MSNPGPTAHRAGGGRHRSTERASRRGLMFPDLTGTMHRYERARTPSKPAALILAALRGSWPTRRARGSWPTIALDPRNLT